MFALGRNQQYPSTCTFELERTVEVHDPMLWVLSRRRNLILSPLSHEVNQCLTLDSGARLELERWGAKLDRPLGDSSCGIPIVKDITERVVCNHRNLVLLKIVS